MSGKNVLDGFSGILDIQNFSGGRPPYQLWKMGYMEWTVILQNFPPHHHYQPASQKKSPPHTHTHKDPWNKIIFKNFIFTSKRDWKKIEEEAGTKINFWQRSSFCDLLVVIGLFFKNFDCAKAENKPVICGSCIVCDLVWPCVICGSCIVCDLVWPCVVCGSCIVCDLVWPCVICGSCIVCDLVWPCVICGSCIVCDLVWPCVSCAK